MLNNNVHKHERCGQHNIVQAYYTAGSVSSETLENTGASVFC